MPTYSHLSLPEQLIMTFITVVTNFAGIPTVVRCFRRASKQTQSSGWFDSFIFTMSIFTSFLYHICEIYDVQIFINDGQWHRLDNVFVITSFCLFIMNGCGLLQIHNSIGFNTMRMLALLVAILSQQKDPWNFSYAVVPILGFGLISAIVRVYVWNEYRVQYDFRKVGISLSFLGIGAIFFIWGLDDENDYLRISHGMWHLCAAVFSWFGLDAVTTFSETNTKAKIIPL